jgi:Secretion system C-terminal sorting domain
MRRLLMSGTRLLSMVLSIAFLAFPLTEANAVGARLHVESVVSAPGEVVGVGVYLGGNTEGFSGANIPLRYSSADVTPDSVSVVGSILDPAMTTFKIVDTDSSYFGVLVLPPFTAPIPKVTVDSGLICTFWFTVSPTASPQDIVIDSLNTVDTLPNSPSTLVLRRVELVDPTGLITTVPTFSPGHIQLLSTGVDDDITDPALPKKFELNQNYPNPFNPSTKIGFSLPAKSTVTLDVFNLLGQRVITLFSGELGPGNHEVEWDASANPSGVYFYRIKTGLGVLTRKMVLMK